MSNIKYGHFGDVAPSIISQVPTAARAERPSHRPYRTVSRKYGKKNRTRENATSQRIDILRQGKEKIPTYLFSLLQAADDLSWSRINFTVSGFLRVMLFCIVQIGATLRAFGRYFSIR